MKYKLILFDLDGTLLDTLKDLMSSINYTLRTLSYPELSIDKVRAYIGNGIPTLIQRSIPHEISKKQLADAYEIFMNYYSNHLYDTTKPFPGIMEMLNSLKDYHIGIISNKTDCAVKDLNAKFFAPLITDAIGATPETKKPDPSMLFALMDKYQVKPSETLYVGDSDVDVITAHNAGVACVGVTWGNRSREVLKEHGAEYIIDSPDELTKLLSL